MRAVEVERYLDNPVLPPRTLIPESLVYRGLHIAELNTTVVCGPTGNILKEIRSGRFNLSPQSEHVFILPPTLAINGKSFADLEFPVYFNAYILGRIADGRPMEVVCTPEQESLISAYMERTIIGPEWRDSRQYAFSSPADRRVLENLQAYYAPKDRNGNVLPMDAFLHFNSFNADGKALVGFGEKGTLRVEQCRDQTGNVAGYEVLHERPDGKTSSLGSLVVEYRALENRFSRIPLEAREEIERNRYGFAVTCLGNSTGFDPEGFNTSFVIWMGGTGLLVDPSEESLSALSDAGFANTDIPAVILTHCHQDHDGGLLRRIMEGRRINLLASRVVYGEFVTKARNLLSCQDAAVAVDPHELVNWTELRVGETTAYRLPSGETAEIDTWWNIHPIPTNGFSLKFRGKSYGHSGDTQWGREFLDKLAAAGVVTAEQAQEHKDRWFTAEGRPKFDLIDFEAGGLPGGSPIHTAPADIVASVTPENRAQVRLYHAPDGALAECEIKKAGLNDTHVISPASDVSQAEHFRRTTESHPYFRNLERLAEVWDSGTLRTFRQGERIITPDDGPRQTMYINVSGTASILGDTGELLGRCGPGSALGDWSHLSGERPSAFVIADSPLTCFEINIHSLAKPEEISRLRESAVFAMKYTSEFSRAFERLGVSVSDVPLLLLEMQDAISTLTAAPKSLLIRRGDNADKLFLLVSGSLEVFEEKIYGDVEQEVLLARILPGQIIGEAALSKERRRRANVRASGEGAELISIDGAQFQEILNRFPGVMNAFAVETAGRYDPGSAHSTDSPHSPS